ncbi:MAG: phenylalanine--tRNA ligase subunit beta [Wenzhouxiangellaceae bacterium]|nr:phenylalanine--tRNA ligase subunit beta [Wenzhouxiangellaceae bacterium]
MQLSFNWLRRWVPGSGDAEAVAERLTGAGLEVDSLTALGEALDGVVVGEIVACEPHPNADRLRVCTVQTGADRALTIVCGAPNARVGLKAPLATIGSTLPNGLTIKAAKLRGVASEGMLCSSPELGLGDDAAGLMELDPGFAAGTPLAAALGLPDHLIEIDLTPNRADCLSVRGIARELAALEGAVVQEPAIDPVPALIDDAPSIELLAPEDCPRYVGRVIDGIDPNATTPAWMVERLERSGLRSRGPGVDVTNYVLLELGQPMHAFDAATLSGGIRVRRAGPGDLITLLDGQTVEPDDDLLLICDHDKPVALAGIMGGADTAVSDGTTRILLESAWFRPATIMGKGRRYGLATDSAHRFERGVDPQLQREAIERATALMLEIAGGRPGPVVEQSVPAHLPRREAVELRVTRVNHVLGTALSADEVRALLERLGMQVTGAGEPFSVIAPSARVDIAVEIDLVEEIARLVGYDRLPSRSPRGRLRAIVQPEREAAMPVLRHSLQARGFHEIMTWSFVAEADLAELQLPHQAQALANPLSRDMAVLRTSLLPGLLRTAAANLKRRQPRLKLFETGHVFHADAEWAEPRRLGLLLAGQRLPEHWDAPSACFDFHDLRGEIEHLAVCLGHAPGAVVFERTEQPWLHPGQAARVLLNGEQLGTAGRLHPALVEAFDLPEAPLVAEIDLGCLRARSLPEYRPVSRYPAVRRDLALIAPAGVESGRIRDVAAAAAGDLLERCIIFDIYQGEGIDSSGKSVAIGLILRDVSRTLTDEEVDRVIAGVVEALRQHCQVELRG